MAERQGTYEDYPAVDRYMSTNMPGINDLLLKLSGQSKFIPSRDADVPIPPTPGTTVPKGTPTPIPQKPQRAEPEGELYHVVSDKSGQQVTLLSANGELKSAADFGKALKNHNAGKETPGFLVQPTGSYSEGIRKGLYQGTREALPAMGEAVGGAIPSRLLELGVKAGLVSPQTQESATQTGATAGRATADYVGQQVDTPGEVGLIAGTALAAPFAAPVAGGSGAMLKTNALLKNPLLFGTAGVAGSTGMKTLTGEDQTLGKAGQEFAMAALGGGIQGVTSYFLTKYFKPDTATKVATEMMDTIKKKYPTLINDSNAFEIANATPKDISNLTSMMSKALRGDAADEVEGLLTSLKSVMPSTPTVAQQNTLRMHNRHLVDAQTKALDNIGDPDAFTKELGVVSQKKEELLQAVRGMFPKVKNIDPTMVRTEEVLSRYSDYVATFREGAQVLHHLKQSGAAEKFNPMEFAQRIKGEYTENPGSLMNQIGNILGQGRSLKTLPPPGEAEPGAEMGKKAFNLMRQLLPKGTQWTDAMKYSGPPTPWPTPPGPSTPEIIAAQQAGQQAMKQFLNSGKEKKWNLHIQ